MHACFIRAAIVTADLFGVFVTQVIGHFPPFLRHPKIQASLQISSNWCYNSQSL